MLRLYIQCKTAAGKLGDFIADDDKVPISPVFEDLMPLYAWMNVNRYCFQQYVGNQYIPNRVEKF